jgi:dolichyl-phosphate-mannose--protein O-mannosyl transferase
MLFGVTAIAGVTRFFRLGTPDKFAFDEVYYAKESCFYVEASKHLCKWPKSPPAEVHPPLAKWLMGLGIKALGFNSWGWRVVAALFGVLGVVLLYLLARKIFHSTLAAVVAGGLLAFDPLHFVQSRVALLDIFPATFGIAAFLFLAYDRDRMLREEKEPDAKRGMLARPWRLAAGIAAGAATASKWTGGLILVAILVLTIVWEISRRRDRGLGRAMGEAFKQESLSIVLFLGLVPFAVYVASYIGRLEGAVLQPFAEHSWAREWLRYQTNAFTFHRGLRSPHGYESPPSTWIALKRPIMYWNVVSGARKATVYAMGNPLIWWPSVVAIGYTFVRWLRTRDWRGPESMILVGFAMTYLSWLVLAPQRSAVFLFYLLPAIPFMCLGVTYVVSVAATGTLRKVAVIATVVLSAGWFFAYYPIIADVPISNTRWDAQMFFNDCDKAPHSDKRTNTVTQAIDRHTTIVKTRTVTDTNTKNFPPVGWCWR